MLAKNFARYLQALTAIDICLERQAVPINGELLREVFDTEDLRRTGLLAQYFAEIGLLPEDGLARRGRSDEALINRKLDSLHAKPWAEDVRRFYGQLANRDPALSVRTRRSYLHAATSFLDYAEVNHAREVTQSAVVGFCRRRPGLRASLWGFLSYLNATHTLSLRAVAPRTTKSVSSQVKHIRSLLDALDRNPSRPVRLALTARLLSKLMKVPMERVLQLHHSDVDMKDFRQIRLDGAWIEAPEALRPILQELPSEIWRRGIDADPLVFPGRLLTDSLSVAAVNHHIKVATGEA